MYTVRSASDAWKLLRGLVCVHKPADGTVPSLLHNLRKRLACDLNDMRRSVEYNSLQIEEKSSKDDDGTKTNHSSDLEKYEGGYEGLVSQNYATHPLVLGKGFMPEDLDVRPINPFTYRESGLMLLTVNDPATYFRIKSKRFPRTYRIHAQFGKRTDTRFTDGKTMEKTTYAHLKNRPQGFNSLLNSIQNSHQKQALKYSKTSLQSQEAYELAAKGPVRPENPSECLIYKLNCVKYSPPDFILDVTCVGGNAEYLSTLIHEIGMTLKTTAVTSSVRCIRVGYFDLNSALLNKHCTLENVIQNIYQNESVLQEYGCPHKHPHERHEDHNFFRPHFDKISCNNSFEID